MRRQVRRHTFETNSSSVHSLTMCSKETYKKWEHGQLYKDRDSNEFYTREEAISLLIENGYNINNSSSKGEIDWRLRQEGFVTEDEFWDEVDYETFMDEFRTSGGETVVAFGYYGENY